VLTELTKDGVDVSQAIESIDAQVGQHVALRIGKISWGDWSYKNARFSWLLAQLTF